MLVDIAMATYNGENFIAEQIQSIQNQTYQNWILYVSDDGSSDGTVDYINEVAITDQRIKLINTQRQGGVIPNFNNALEYTSADYIVLCDQDDIWPKERLAVLVNKIRELEVNSGQPLMIFTDMILIDAKGLKIADSFYQSNKLNPNINLEENSLIWRSTVYGCSTIMNRALLNISLPVPEYAQMHDQWLALNAKQSNNLYYYDYQSLKYRQHANNVVGGSHKGLKGKLSSFWKSLKNIKISVLKIKSLLSARPDLYTSKKKFVSYFDFVAFAFKEILPKVFLGDKKMQTFFILLFFLMC